MREHWAAVSRAGRGGGRPAAIRGAGVRGVLALRPPRHGVVRLACRPCGHEMLVAFSCKRRGFCPSCVGRRMSDVAAHLVDEVLPEEPMRQWVCSLPWSLRYAMAYDHRLCADVHKSLIRAFIRALTRSLRRRTKRHLELRSVDEAQVGAVTFIQRSDSALRLNVHFHTLATGGVYVRDAQGALVFHALSPPSGDEVAEVAAWTHAALLVVLERHVRSLEGPSDQGDTLVHEQPVLASCYAASAGDVQLLGAAPGAKTAKLVHPVRLVPSPSEALAEVGGVVRSGNRARRSGRQSAKLHDSARLSARASARRRGTSTPRSSSTAATANVSSGFAATSSDRRSTKSASSSTPMGASASPSRPRGKTAPTPSCSTLSTSSRGSASLTACTVPASSRHSATGEIGWVAAAEEMRSGHAASLRRDASREVGEEGHLGWIRDGASGREVAMLLLPHAAEAAAS
ncbi:MAG: transposase zinc-binding domain-containing protein [Myxococcales bacterium]|nr:transposase zinc-binding domain-containing protein [Myxococcales bacterium]